MPPLHILRRNIKLTSSWSIIFAFIINPIISIGWFSLTCNAWFRGLFPFEYHHMKLAIWCMFCSITVIPFLATHQEERRLKSLGWDVKPTWLGQIDHWSWVAMFFGCQYWLDKVWGDEGAFEWWIFRLIIRGLCIYLGLVLGHLASFGGFSRGFHRASIPIFTRRVGRIERRIRGYVWRRHVNNAAAQPRRSKIAVQVHVFKHRSGPYDRTSITLQNSMPSLRILRRNIKLTSSWTIIFAFIISPLMALAFLCLTAAGYFRSLLPPEPFKMWLALVPYLASLSIIPYMAASHEEKRLKALGWHVRPTGLGLLDWVSWIALCLGFFYWISREHPWGSDEDYGVFHGARLIAPYLAMVLGSLGRLWWFLTWDP